MEILNIQTATQTITLEPSDEDPGAIKPDILKQEEAVKDDPDASFKFHKEHAEEIKKAMFATT